LFKTRQLLATLGQFCYLVKIQWNYYHSKRLENCISTRGQ